MSPAPLPAAPPPEFVVLDQEPAPACGCGAPRLLMYPADAPTRAAALAAGVLMCIRCDDWPQKRAVLLALSAAMSERGL